MRAVEVNHVCDSEPWCLCVGGETAWDECCCTYEGFAHCGVCGAAMRKVDVSTGEDVLEHCELQWVVEGKS